VKRFRTGVQTSIESVWIDTVFLALLHLSIPDSSNSVSSLDIRFESMFVVFRCDQSDNFSFSGNEKGEVV